MAAMSNLLALKFANMALKNVTGTIGVATLYISLFTTLQDDPESAGVEVPVGDGYARESIAAAGWTTATDGSNITTGKNTAAITFTVASGTGWGLITGFGIHTAVSGIGTLYLHGSLAADVQINSGDTFEFAASAMVLTFN